MHLKGLSPTEPELKLLFEQQVGERGTQESNWEAYAGWTLPYLYPDDNFAQGTEMQHDYQALGAQAVNHLSNKIVMTLFAPARPFFRLELTEEQKATLISKNVKEADIELLTSAVEKKAMKNMEKVRLRTSVIAAVKALITLGNTCIFFPPGEKRHSQVYSVRDYTVLRDSSGSLLQLITRDRRVASTLPDEARLTTSLAGHDPEDEIVIYTGVTRREDGKFFIKQEVEAIAVIEEEGAGFGIMPEEKLLWLPLTWTLVRGENYGVGLVEEYAGDFSVYSSLSQANLNLASLAADIKILINPMGSTDVDALNNSESGTYMYGLLDDVAYLQLEKIADFKFVTEIMDMYQRRIAAGFLMQSQVTRDAERVTTEEIRMNAHELEGSLGGVYSRLAEEMQQPLARMLLSSINEELVKLDPTILTGVESLSRSSEHEQILLFIQDLSLLNNVPDAMIGELDLSSIGKTFAANRGVDSDIILKSPEQKAKDQRDAINANAEDALKQGAAEEAGKQIGGGGQPSLQ